MSVFLESLSNFAGVIGCFLSVFILLRDRYRSRIRFSLDVIDYDVYAHSTRFYVSISNLSHSPLVITRIHFDGILCELDPKKIRKPPDPLPLLTTPQFPLAIEALGARLFYIEFLNHSPRQLTHGTPVTFQIHTISRQVSKTVLLGNTSHYLNIKR